MRLLKVSVYAFLKVFLTLGFSLAVLANPTPPTPYFMGLGSFPGGLYSSAVGLSPGGTFVVGNSGATGNGAFLWSHATGMEYLGALAPGTDSFAYGVSADGRVVVGYGFNQFGPNQAFRWTRDNGMQGLSFLTGRPLFSLAYGISADGSIAVGNSGGQAVRWTATGVQSLGSLPGVSSADPFSVATAVSADGSVIVGYGQNASNVMEAFLWTASTGMLGLGVLPDKSYSFAYGVSSDGATVVGVSWQPAGSEEAFRWTQSGGMEGLGFLPGGSRSGAVSVSADGSVVVGVATDSSNLYRAIRWTPTEGMRTLQDILTIDYGLDLNGWNLTSANGVSADGFVIVGNGINPQGRPEAWIANLRPGDLAVVPEPAATALFALCGFALYGLRRVRQSKNTRNEH